MFCFYLPFLGHCRMVYRVCLVYIESRESFPKIRTITLRYSSTLNISIDTAAQIYTGVLSLILWFSSTIFRSHEIKPIKQVVKPGVAYSIVKSAVSYRKGRMSVLEPDARPCGDSEWGGRIVGVFQSLYYLRLCRSSRDRSHLI